MFTIFQKEFKSYFTSPIAYVFMAFFLFMFGLYFTMVNIFSQNGDYSYVIASLTTVLLFATPILTMRLLSEERKNKTDQLLITSPIKVSDIVLGKFFSATTLLLLTLVITMIHPILLSTLGKIPTGKILGAYLGYFLLGTTLIAIGTFISALCENQIVSAIVTIGTYLFLMLIDSIAAVIPKQRMASAIFILIIFAIVCGLIYLSIKNLFITIGIGIVGIAGVVGTFLLKGELFDGLSTKILQWLSIFERFDSFASGLLDISSVVYYISFIFLFVFLTIQAIEKRSWS